MHNGSVFAKNSYGSGGVYSLSNWGLKRCVAERIMKFCNSKHPNNSLLNSERKNDIQSAWGIHKLCKDLWGFHEEINKLRTSEVTECDSASEVKGIHNQN